MKLLPRNLGSMKISKRSLSGWMKQIRKMTLARRPLTSLEGDRNETIPSVQLKADHVVFGRFRLIRPLGAGASGIVWEAEDLNLRCHVAVKFLSPALRWEGAALDAFNQEVRRARESPHPNIVRVHDFFETHALVGFSMDLVKGRSLSEMLVDRLPLPFEARELERGIGDVCSALHCLHEAGLVHRDVKPSNLIMDKHGKLRLVDFGASALIAADSFWDRLTLPGGTVPYMSPQHRAGEVPSVSDDVYSLGATLYELLTTKPPFASTGARHMLMRPSSPVSMNRRRLDLGIQGEPIPPCWEEAVAACLSEEAEKRPATAAIVAAMFEGGVSGSARGGRALATFHEHRASLDLNRKRGEDRAPEAVTILAKLSFDDPYLPAGWSLHGTSVRSGIRDGRLQAMPREPEVELRGRVELPPTAMSMAIRFQTGLTRNHWGMRYELRLSGGEGEQVRVTYGKAGAARARLEIVENGGARLQRVLAPAHGMHECTVLVRDGQIHFYLGADDAPSVADEWMRMEMFCLAVVERISIVIHSASGLAAWIDDLEVEIESETPLA